MVLHFTDSHLSFPLFSLVLSLLWQYMSVCSPAFLLPPPTLNRSSLSFSISVHVIAIMLSINLYLISQYNVFAFVRNSPWSILWFVWQMFLLHVCQVCVHACAGNGEGLNDVHLHAHAVLWFPFSPVLATLPFSLFPSSRLWLCSVYYLFLSSQHKSLLQALLYRKAWPFFMLWVLLLKGGLLVDAGGCRNRRRRKRPWNFNICHVNTRQECVVPAPQNKSRNPGLSLPPAAAACQVLFELLSLAIICKKKTKFSPSPDLPAGTIFLSM